MNKTEKTDKMQCDKSNEHEEAHSVDANQDLSKQAIVVHASNPLDMLCDRLERASLCMENSVPLSTVSINDSREQDISYSVRVVRSASVSSLTESARSAMSPHVVSPTSVNNAVETVNASASSISASLSAFTTSSRIGSSGISEIFSDVGGDVSSISVSESDELSSLSSFSSTAPQTSARTVENVPCALIQLEMHHLAVYDEFWPPILHDNMKASKRCRNHNRMKEAESTQATSSLSPHEQEHDDTLFSHIVFTCPTVLSINDPSRDNVIAPSHSNERFLGFDELRGILLRFVCRRHLFLDVGCGTSDICRQLVLHGYNHVYGIDVDEAKVSFQRQRTLVLGEYVRMQRMNAADMTFPDEFFDCVFTKAILDEIACGKRFLSSHETQIELLRVLGEILRCLKPGGIWILVTCQTSTQRPRQRSAVDSDLNPWWQWEVVEKVIQHHVLLETEYHAGIPCTFEEMPFVIRIYRRFETATQRLRRIWLERDEQLRYEAENQAFDRCQQNKHLKRTENESREREARQMIQEDMEAALWASAINYKGAKNNRDMIRKVILERIKEEERAVMVEEDSQSARMQAYVVTMLKQIDGIICDLVNHAAERGRQRIREEQSKEKIAEARNLVTVSSERQGNLHDRMLACAMDVINKIIGNLPETQLVRLSLEPNSLCEVRTAELSGKTVDPTLNDSNFIIEGTEQQIINPDNGEIQSFKVINEMVQPHSNDLLVSEIDASTSFLRDHEPTLEPLSTFDRDRMSCIQSCIDMLIERVIVSSGSLSIVDTETSINIHEKKDLIMWQTKQ